MLLLTCVSTRGNAIASVHSPIRLSICHHSNFWTEWPLTLTFCMCIGHDHNCPLIEGQRSRSTPNPSHNPNPNPKSNLQLEPNLQTLTPTLRWFSVKDSFTAWCHASVVLATIMCLSICLIVCPSISHQNYIKKAKPRITRTLPHDSSGSLVFWCRRWWSPWNLNGVTLKLESARSLWFKLYKLKLRYMLFRQVQYFVLVMCRMVGMHLQSFLSSLDLHLAATSSATYLSGTISTYVALVQYLYYFGFC